MAERHIVIIGGGISGLATAFYIKQHLARINSTAKITVLESESVIGGKIQSYQENGYLCEWGPNGFLTNKPDTLELCQSLGLTEQLLSSNDNARKRFVVSNGELNKLPHNQIEFLTNSLISWRGKLRIAAEIFQSQRISESDESLADFTRRRLGQEALDKLIAPMASGIFAGDPETMSLRACFPRIYQLEQQYGGLLKAMLVLMKQHRKEKKNGQVSASPAGPGGVLTSFATGIATLTKQLASAIGEENVLLDHKVIAIQHNDNVWTVQNQNGQTIIADQIVLATPAYVAKDIIQPSLPNVSELLNQINYSPLAVVCLGYNLKHVRCDVNGFGYLFATGENQHVLGTLWDSSIFASRAPDNIVLFRSMLGGAKYPDILNYTDKELESITRQQLHKIMMIDNSPAMVKIFRHKYAIPQYRVGHCELVKQIENSISEHSGLHLNNNAYYGVGINDCIAAAKKVALKVVNDYII